MKAIQVIREEGWKVFIEKWKSGIAQTTPLQSTNAQITFTVISMIGILLGFIVSIANAKNFWWLAIILGAAFGNTYIGYVGLKQKQKLLKQLEEPIEEQEESIEQILEEQHNVAAI